MAEDEALFQKGMPIRREVLGPEYVDASTAGADEFMMSSSGRPQPGNGLGVGGWNTRPKDPQLDEPGDAHCLEPGRPRSGCTLRAHSITALQSRRSKAALLHATAYCGIPAGLDAFCAAHEVLVSDGALTKS